MSDSPSPLDSTTFSSVTIKFLDNKLGDKVVIPTCPFPPHHPLATLEGYDKDHKPYRLFVYIHAFPVDIDEQPDFDSIIDKKINEIAKKLYGEKYECPKPSVQYSTFEEPDKRFFTVYKYEFPYPHSINQRDELELQLDFLCDDLVDDDITAFYHFQEALDDSTDDDKKNQEGKA